MNLSAGWSGVPAAVTTRLYRSFKENWTTENDTFLEYCETFDHTADEVKIEEHNIIFNFILYGILLNVIGILGIFGNIISMIILSRPQMKSSINYLLIGLARCDTILIITSILLFGLPSVYPATGYLFAYYHELQPLIAPYVYPAAMISQTVSVYLTLIVTLERFVAVCHPLQARSLCTCGRARFYMFFVIVFSVLYNVTRFREVDVKRCLHNVYKLPIYRVNPSALRNNPVYIKIYIHWMYLIFMYFVPFTFLAVLNTSIYRQVRRANQERQRLSRLQKKEIGLATMLLCVVVVFLICNLLALVSNVLEAFWGKTYDLLVEIGNLMVTINSSVNFVIYVIFGEKFKILFFKLFFPHGLRFCGNAFGSRESPDQMFENSYVSCNGDRGCSIRQHLHRLNTTYSKSGSKKTSNRHHQCRKMLSARIHRTSSLGPCVHCAARDSRTSLEHTSTTNF